MQRAFLVDEGHKESSFYIREKIEISVLAERLGPPWLEIVLVAVLVIFLYGSMSLKYASGA
jgi:hypothetical protein